MRHDLLVPGAPAKASVRRIRQRVLRQRSVPSCQAGFQRSFSCRCWPLMVRIIWFALRHRD
jgi:hypothetical protein